MPKIAIPTALRRYAGEQAFIEVQGTIIKEALASMTVQYPDLQKTPVRCERQIAQFRQCLCER